MGGDFRAAYVPGTTLTGAGQSVGLLQFDGYAASDITNYEGQAGLPNVPLLNVLLDGATGNPSGSGGEVEVSLDIEMAISMAPNLSSVIVYMAANPSPFVDLLSRMATDNLAKQLSCSWYIPGGGVDPVADQIFQQMAAQGQSFFSASGDNDAFSGPVDFPSETPYIVQVGGTMLTTTGPRGAWVSETTWNRNNGIGSGGGISTRYVIPSYQTDINMSLNQGSTTMRNIPDVAFTAENVYVRADGQDESVGGTSCAAPLWAGFTALVNQQAVGTGRPVVGFINPALDTIGHAANYTTCFHDITTGNNTSGDSPDKFYAVAGYDLCTGWGTPAGQSLINALTAINPLIVSPAALAFAGAAGGPFSPNPGTLTLTNAGTNALSWSLVNTSAWFDVSPPSGTLAPGGPAATVSVAVDPAANTLPAGIYTSVVVFTNQTSGLAQSCALSLSVAAPGMADDFDPGIDLSQWSAFGGVVGSTVLATNYGGSVSAPNSLWFGADGNRYATTVPINTSGGGQIGFCLRLANGPAWPWANVDSLPAEGIVLESSTNGGANWTALGNYDTSTYYNWTGVTLPVPPVAQGPAVVFRWRQLSNDGANYDHWALDNVIIGTGLFAPRIVMDPQSQAAEVDDTVSLSVAAVGTLPLSYQWRLNGTNISGATASALVWTNVQLPDAGTYAVLVANSAGSVTSTSAVLTLSVPVCTPPVSGLVSWWAAEGDATDVLGANNGAVQGGTTFAKGKVGQGFSFDGTTGTMIVPDSSSLRLTNQLTIEAWINTRSITTDRAIVSKVGGAGGDNGYQLVLSGSTLVGQFNGPAQSWPSFRITSGGLIAAGAWYHVAWTYDQSAMTLYVNGVPVATSFIGPQPIAASSSNLHISGDDNDHVYFDGLIDEASVYSRALSAAEIAALYHAGNAGKCRTPIPPSISAQPQSQIVIAGANASLQVAAAGALPMSYQWHCDGTNLPGATSFALALAPAQSANSGTYDVVITNLYGATNSAMAVLTVVTPAQITGQPQSQTVGVGSNVTFTVAAIGTSPLAYQWLFNGAPLSAATASRLVLNGVGLNQAGDYSVSVSNPYASVVSQSASLVVVPVGTCTPPPAGLVSWWAGEGSALDAATNNNGSLQGGAGFAGGVVGQAFSFDGATGSVEVPDSSSLRLTNQLTIETWINTRSVNTDRGIVSKVGGVGGNNGYQLYLHGGILGGQFNSPGQNWPSARITSGNLLATGVWYHVAWTYDQSAMTLYINGQPTATSGIGAQVIAASSSNLRIGNDDNGNTPFDGLIDEASVYNRALTASEIAAIYNAGSAGKCRLGPSTPPVITRQPRSVVAVPGASVAFSVSATGLSPLSYQWQKNGAALAGQTRSSLSISNVQAADFATYTVGVTNAGGGVLSAAATLTRVASPVISSLNFNSATFMLAIPTEAGPTYILEYKNSLADPSWTVLTTITGTGSPIHLSDNGQTNAARFYRVQVR